MVLKYGNPIFKIVTPIPILDADSFVRNWFKDYIEGIDDKPAAVTFLDSLTTLMPKSKKTKEPSSLREKLVFHLLKHNNVNGNIVRIDSYNSSNSSTFALCIRPLCF